MRNTRQREAIRFAFERADRPLSPSECRALAARRISNLGIATVYRNIKRLAAEGWLRVVELPGAPNRYEISGKRHHHHFHCSSCDAVFDVEECPGNLAAMTPSGFQLEDHQIILYGRCCDCAAP